MREPGDGSPLCRYEPLTERFVHDHAGELRELDSFGAACAAIESAGLAGPYLERMGIGVPAEPRQRAELAGIAFLCRLWMDSSDFSLDDERARRRDRRARGRRGDADRGRDRGDRPAARPADAGRAARPRDRVDRPRRHGRRARRGARRRRPRASRRWEPTFLAVGPRRRARRRPTTTADAGLAAVEAFRRLITTLRLFKAGGVGLGPHAWTRIAGDRWRRIATGAGRQRPGGYRLAETELGELVAFSRALAVAGDARSAARPRAARGFPAMLGRALARFEAGLERNVVVEALNDHLLALRFLLEGGGPADLGLLDAGRGALRRARRPRRGQGGRRPRDRRSSASSGAASPRPAPGR